VSIPATTHLLQSARADRPAAPRDDAERRRAANYPLSRWYLRPAAALLAAALAPTIVRPWHLTLGGLLAAIVAAASLLWLPAPAAVTAGFILAGWFLDRCDGMLARRQGTASPLGAWLDANVDELVDVGLHAAVAWAAASATDTALPWALLIGFLAGKYLFVYGLAEERQLLAAQPKSEATAAENSTHAASDAAPRWAWLRRLYHLPGNADVRVHLLAGAVLCGWLTAELAVVAAYYNARWIARYLLVARRLRSEAP